MSLLGFHRFLIVTAIAFCFGYGIWEFSVAVERGGLSAYILGAIFTVLGVGLVVYLRNLGRILGYREGKEPR